MKFCKVMVPTVGLGFLSAVTALPVHAQDPMAADEASDAVVAPVTEAAAPTDPYADGSDSEGFESFESRVSYALGANIGGGMTEQFSQVGFALDLDAFVAAFRAAADEGDAKLDDAQIEATLIDFQQKMQVMQFEQMQRQAEENAAVGAAFLEGNKDKEGVQTTESGLQYIIEKKGDGVTPALGDTVLVHYEGTLLDGTVFDSSHERGQPAPFPLNQEVIAGFSEGLALMPVGTEGTLFIPAELGFGVNPPPDSGIGINEMLTFKVQVLDMLDDVDAVEAPAEGADTREALGD